MQGLNTEPSQTNSYISNSNDISTLMLSATKQFHKLKQVKSIWKVLNTLAIAYGSYSINPWQIQG